jgi:hypothetical protein
MFPVITNIYNKKTKGPTLMEFFTATGKLKKFFMTPLPRDLADLKASIFFTAAMIIAYSHNEVTRQLRNVRARPTIAT